MRGLGSSLDHSMHPAARGFSRHVRELDSGSEHCTAFADGTDYPQRSTSNTNYLAFVLQEGLFGCRCTTWLDFASGKEIRMTISAELFNEILAKLSGDMCSGRTTERRQQARVGLRAKLQIDRLVMTDHGTMSLSVQLRDISRAGIGLVSSVRLNRDDRFRATFHGGDGSKVVATYVVRHTHPLTSTQFMVGAELEEMVMQMPKPLPMLRRIA
jgi:hypothetical protein